MSRLSNLFQFILGFVLGVALLGVGAVTVGYLFFARMSVAPPKPIFAEEKPKESPVTQKKESPAAVKKPKPTPVKTEEKVTEATAQEKEELPAGTYKARVTWSSGLSLRDGPNAESNRVGGLDYNTEIIVVETSADGTWQKVRLSDGQEGWIKAGNAEKLE